MIKKETIDKILETAIVEEVVGDFVYLKKRGTSLIGLCPFHGEKSPSFHVSPAKGIYKCFGCGKGGDSVNFIMEHEKYSYPEALKYLAAKYNIEVEETEVSPEFKEEQDRRESLYIVSNYAAKFFENNMWNTDTGKTIGLSYFKERGFRDDIIKKFELGYSPEDWSALLDTAIKDGYQQNFLEDVGLVIKTDQGKVYDRFRGRVMFPIHNFTGRVIGFGGRTLKTDKAVPKYVNSPESDIYHKSNVLYGLFQAKKAIRDLDNCYLVEGYADVLSVHQAFSEKSGKLLEMLYTKNNHWKYEKEWRIARLEGNKLYNVENAKAINICFGINVSSATQKFIKRELGNNFNYIEMRLDRNFKLKESN